MFDFSSISKIAEAAEAATKIAEAAEAATKIADSYSKVSKNIKTYRENSSNGKKHSENLETLVKIFTEGGAVEDVEMAVLRKYAAKEGVESEELEAIIRKHLGK